MIKYGYMLMNFTKNCENTDLLDKIYYKKLKNI